MCHCCSTCILRRHSASTLPRCYSYRLMICHCRKQCSYEGILFHKVLLEQSHRYSRHEIRPQKTDRNGSYRRSSSGHAAYSLPGSCPIHGDRYGHSGTSYTYYSGQPMIGSSSPLHTGRRNFLAYHLSYTPDWVTSPSVAAGNRLRLCRPIPSVWRTGPSRYDRIYP